MIADHDHHHLQPNHTPNLQHQIHHITSLPADLAHLDEATQKENSSSKSSMIRKQIQFNVDEKKAAAAATVAASAASTTSNRRSTLFRSKTQKAQSSIHETLKQLKLDEMRKRKNRGVNEGRRKKSKSKLDFKKLKHKFNELQKEAFKYIYL